MIAHTETGWQASKTHAATFGGWLLTKIDEQIRRFTAGWFGIEAIVCCGLNQGPL